MASYKKWTNAELDFIKNNYLSIPDENLAVKLSQITSSNISADMVRRQRRKMKLSKPKGRPNLTKRLLPEDISENYQYDNTMDNQENICCKRVG